jgi:hypothetical protein
MQVEASCMEEGKAMAIIVEDAGGWRANRWRIIGWGAAALVLLLPLIANAPWSVSDFIFMGMLFGIVGLGLELAARKGNTAYTMAIGVALAAGFLLIVINGAVGIIGSEREDANLLFLGVVAVALLGAAVARFRAAGMARAMIMAALGQLLVPVVASVFGLASMASLLAREVPILTGVFAAIWLLSAWLFRKAAHAE